MLAELEKDIRAAGFGDNPEWERASIYLTEAEAASHLCCKAVHETRRSVSCLRRRGWND